MRRSYARLRRKSRHLTQIPPSRSFLAGETAWTREASSWGRVRG